MTPLMRFGCFLQDLGSARGCYLAPRRWADDAAFRDPTLGPRVFVRTVVVFDFDDIPDVEKA